MSTEFKKAVAYCRVKPSEQYEETIEQQKNIINKYAEENGYTRSIRDAHLLWSSRSVYIY